MRGLPYQSIADFDLGVRYLQLMGVRYYAAFSEEAKAKAATNPALRPVATVPDLDGKPPSGWTIYRVADSPTVQALAYEPVVVDDLHAAPSWQCDGRAEAGRHHDRASPSTARGSAPRSRGSTTRTRSTGRSPTAVPRRGRAPTPPTRAHA